MALHFDYASAIATTSSKRPTATATRGSSYAAPLTLRFLYSFMEKATTTTGLKVTVDILAGIYETGKKCATDFIKNRRIVFDDFLPRWNYRTLPHG
ncbi:ISAzo13-like element transposase-related protein [Methylobacter sp.]|uniref:ISAzo13-like element transposase-related protein n=2 Tax=Methylobacter sp. TaxID=2051955 RepID=UPI002FDD7E7D